MALLSSLAVVLGALGAAGAYYRLLSPAFGFYLCFVAVAVIALNLPVHIVRFVKRGKRGVSFAAMLLGLIGMAALGGVLKFAIENPVTDVTNNPSSPPPFRHPASSIPVPPDMKGFIDPSFLISRDYDPAFAEKQLKAYPNLYLLLVPAPPESALALAQSVVAKHPEWRVVHVDQENKSLEIEAEQPFFHAVDDFLIQAQPLPEGSQILLRSRSRFGFTDFGFNAQRLRAFSEEFAALGASMTPPMKVEYRK
jgi:uncharacterized protein (DUF1499 family)